MLFDRLIHSQITPVVVGIVGALLTPSVAFGQMKMDVSTLGKKIGVLDVSQYTNQSDNTKVKLSITGNFTKDGIEPGGEDILKKWFPNGLTYMQTMSFMFDSGKQQKIFRDMNGDMLMGTWSDPPQMGYTVRDGSKPFQTDSTPWYSDIQPTMVAGDIPPSYGWTGGPASAQFFDMPMTTFAPVNGIDGLLGLLNGKNGMWNFETTLVGVKEKPTKANEEKTGIYKVLPLKTFTWGFNFMFQDDGMDGITSSDYKVTLKDLAFTNKPSDAFKGAFDKKGDNKDVEWNVMFVEHTPPPRMEKDPNKPQIKDSGSNSVAFTGTSLDFSNLIVTDALLDNQIPSINDPILGGNILIGSASLLGEDPGNGWFFNDSTYQILVGGIPVLTADLVDNFLFASGGSMPRFDSEFQGTFKNIQINNVINSPYLDTLQNQINSPRFVSVFSNILAATNNLTTPGSSETVLMDGGKSVPEPTSPLSLLILGTLGAASTLKRKLKPSKSTEKETTKVG